MFVTFSRFYGHFKSLAFFENLGDKLYTKAVKRNALVNFDEVQILSNNCSKNAAILTKKRGQTYARLFQQKTMVLWKTLWPFGLFSGANVTTLICR